MRTNLQKSLPWILLIMVLSACQPTRHVPQGKYFLKSAPKLEADKRLPEGELSDAIRLEANRKVAVSRVYLGFFNIGTSLRNDSSFIKRSLLKVSPIKKLYNSVVAGLTSSIGEAPIMVNLDDLRVDSTALRNVCLSHGFFHPIISFEVDTLKTLFGQETREAKVTYLVDAGIAYKINSVSLSVKKEFVGDSIQKILAWDKSLLQPDMPYDQSLLVRERGRITDHLRNSGYFTASPQLISFFVDSLTNEDKSAALTLFNTKYLNIQVLIDSLPRAYTISEITIQVRSDASAGGHGPEASQSLRAASLTSNQKEALGISPKVLDDSVSITFVVNESLIPTLNFNFIAARIHLKENKPYSLNEARLTQQRLQELGMFRYTVIKYEIDEAAQTMRVQMDLQMAPHFQVKAGMESFYNGFGTIGNNLPSVGGNVTFRNRNAFDKSELLELGFSGSVGFYSSETDGSALQSLFYGLSSQLSLNIPGLLVPFLGRRDLSDLSPVTLLGTDVVLDQRREFRRVKVGASTSYRWNHYPFSTLAISELTPFSLEYIDTQTDSTFQVDIVDKLPPAIRRDFEQRISSRLQYSFTYQDYRSTRARPTSWSKFAVEIGGNLPYLLDNLEVLKNGTRDTSSSDQLLAGRLFYGQYVKASAEIKYLIPFRNKSDLVFRMFIGGAVPYNGTPTVPRESRFFSGGPSSMRGWRSNTLGPGTLSLEDLADESNQFSGNGLSLIAPGGEWIFEANAEYRFDLFSPFFELGLFTDVGNVWFHNSTSTIEQLGKEAVISPENIRLGWDAGIGLRFDFEFVIFRVDFGQQIFAPDIGWVVGGNGLLRLPEPSIGVDYPF